MYICEFLLCKAVVCLSTYASSWNYKYKLFLWPTTSTAEKVQRGNAVCFSNKKPVETVSTHQHLMKCNFQRFCHLGLTSTPQNTSHFSAPLMTQREVDQGHVIKCSARISKRSQSLKWRVYLRTFTCTSIEHFHCVRLKFFSTTSEKYCVFTPLFWFSTHD